MATAGDFVPSATEQASGLGWRWPAGAVGGGLAFVALGAIGLNLLGASSPDALAAGSIPTLSAPTSTIAQAVTTTSSDLSDSAAGEPGFGREGQARSTLGEDELPLAPRSGSSPNPSIPFSSSTTIAVDTTIAESLAAETSEAEPQLTEPAPGVLGPFGPAVFASPHPDQLLGSFVAVENYLLTSARALNGHGRVYLLIDQSWIPADVAGADPLSDVAVLTVDPAVWELGLPSDSQVQEPIGADTTIFVGYCPKELLLKAWAATIPPSPTAGCGPVKPNEVLPEPQPVSEATAPDTTEDPQAEDDEDDDFLTAEPFELPLPPDEEPGRRASGGEHTVEIKRRLGNVWSTSQTVDRLVGHNIYDLIKTSVPKNEQMAGAALRNTVGEVVGLVVAAETPNVVALPIDRALRTAEALMTNGSGSLTWLGLQSTYDAAGLRVEDVDDLSPAAGLILPGDRLISIDGQPVQDLDHLIHLIRMTETGESIVVTVTRDETVLVFNVVVGQVPEVQETD